MFKRTRTCADLVGRQGAGLMGVQLGSLAEWAAMRQRFMVRSGRWSLRTHLPCFAALRGPEGLASPPHGGVFYAARSSLAEVSVPEGTESMNRVNVPRRATVVGRQPGEPAAMSLRERSCQSRERPRKWPGSVAERLYADGVTTPVVTLQDNAGTAAQAPDHRSPRADRPRAVHSGRSRPRVDWAHRRSTPQGSVRTRQGR